MTTCDVKLEKVDGARLEDLGHHGYGKGKSKVIRQFLRFHNCEGHRYRGQNRDLTPDTAPFSDNELIKHASHSRVPKKKRVHGANLRVKVSGDLRREGGAMERGMNLSLP
ncbi:hypothetical protein CEXT_179101 [Caerostris extrusa]|uniref:Uncharacterized protein n=1 Tax=Caerostris extrusa TaxID=172846 RepID=A0AAV4RZ41_CAEEX|nr:hypothetical protein CEXT_179101 [Caerostris extrusa]